MKYLSTLLLIAIYAIWAIIFYLIIRASILGLRSKHWPATGGKVIVSHLKKLPGKTGMIISKYKATICYEYTINDVRYTSDVVSFGDLAFQLLNKGLRSKRGAEYRVLNYPVGSKVTVYYDPDHPKRAILKPGIFNFNLILIVAIFGIIGLFLLYGLLATYF